MLCKCDCGNTCVVSLGHLRSGHTKSCGCLTRDFPVITFTKHGDSKSKLYKMWTQMLQRCYNSNYHEYYNYGGRGINVCDSWSNYSVFKEWALANGYSVGLQIDRINNYLGYSPDNCRWVTRKVNNRNRRNNRTLILNGECHLICEWVEITGIDNDTITKRIDRNGWSVEEALCVKVGQTRKQYWKEISKICEDHV
jgi:hypothetical protein